MKTLRILIILFLSESECSMYIFTNIFSGYRPVSVLAIAVSNEGCVCLSYEFV